MSGDTSVHGLHLNEVITPLGRYVGQDNTHNSQRLQLLSEGLAGDLPRLVALYCDSLRESS